jgi:hypothetical protein
MRLIELKVPVITPAAFDTPADECSSELYTHQCRRQITDLYATGAALMEATL